MTTAELPSSLSHFAAFARALKGDEKSEAQLFLDHSFRALGHGGVQEAGAIIGNPPYLGAKRLVPEHGAAYAKKVRAAFPDVPGMADFCVYWFRKAHDELAPGGRAGLVGTQNIRNNQSRIGGLDYIVENGGVITEAVSTQVWSGDAAVHVSIVNWQKRAASLEGLAASSFGENVSFYTLAATFDGAVPSLTPVAPSFRGDAASFTPTSVTDAGVKETDAGVKEGADPEKEEADEQKATAAPLKEAAARVKEAAAARQEGTGPEKEAVQALKGSASARTAATDTLPEASPPRRLTFQRGDSVDSPWETYELPVINSSPGLPLANPAEFTSGDCIRVPEP